MSSLTARLTRPLSRPLSLRARVSAAPPAERQRLLAGTATDVYGLDRTAGAPAQGAPVSPVRRDQNVSAR